MASDRQRQLLKEGVARWNDWRTKNPQVNSPDLEGTTLAGIELSGVNLSSASLRRASFHNASLVGADLNQAILCLADLSSSDLRRASLIEADLQGADLSGALLRRADLCGANLSEANLTGTDLTMADLKGADLTGATIDQTMFANVNLGETRGLETVQHLGPSTVGIDTLAMSDGAIPEIFLRGCGVPESFITYAPSLIFKPFEFYSCFISYSSKDQEFAERLHADLRQRGLRVWFAPEDLKIGDRFHTRIEDSIRIYDKVMIILSKHSVDSAWVEREVLAAREREDHEKRAILFPIHIDNAIEKTTQPWAADLRRSRHIGDLTKWKDHTSYKKALERLLRDLQQEIEFPVRRRQ